MFTNICPLNGPSPYRFYADTLNKCVEPVVRPVIIVPDDTVEVYRRLKVEPEPPLEYML